MKKFLVKLVVFSLIVSAVILYFSINFKRKFDIKTDYLAAIIDKETRLNSLDSNRLILVGGSNLAFGINGEMIESKLPVKVANLGLHAGLSLEFMINEVRHLMKKGDMVILTFEYPLYLDSFEPDIDLIQFTQQIYPKAKQYYHFSPKQMITARYEKFKKYFQPDIYQIDSVFNRQLFDKYGDNTGHLNKKPLANLIDRKPINIIKTGKSINILKPFEQECKKEGIRVFISYPTYSKTEYTGKNKERLDALDVDLREKLPDIVFLNRPEEEMYDDTLFYDTIYHLNAQGREKRTIALIENLKAYLPQ